MPCNKAMLNQISLFEDLNMHIQKLYKEIERTSLLKKKQPDLAGSQESSQAAECCAMNTTRCLGPRGLWVHRLQRNLAGATYLANLKASSCSPTHSAEAPGPRRALPSTGQALAPRLCWHHRRECGSELHNLCRKSIASQGGGGSNADFW